MAETAWKVKLSCFGSTVVFDASAIVAESRSSTWDGYQITHLPSSLLSYRYTSARKFGVQAKLVSRNKDEATTNASYLNLIRSWILPDFGVSGATPPTCKFSAYANNNIQDLPVIIDQYSWTFPEDVDYIFTGEMPMPVIGVINLELQEIYSAWELTNQEWRIKQSGISSVNGLASNNAINGLMSSLGFSNSTPSIAALTNGLAGLMTGSNNGLSSIISNPTSGSVTGTTNSPQISSSSINTANNPFISGGGIGGELSGVPSAPFSSPSISANDGFNRGSFSNDFPVLG